MRPASFFPSSVRHSSTIRPIRAHGRGACAGRSPDPERPRSCSRASRPAFHLQHPKTSFESRQCGVLCLHGGASELSIMDRRISAVRTGSAGALAADVGASRRGRWRSSAPCGRHQLPNPAVRAWSGRELRRRVGAPRVRPRGRRPGRLIEPTLPSPTPCATSTSCSPRRGAGHIAPGMLAPGAHVSTLGPDEPGKRGRGRCHPQHSSFATIARSPSRWARSAASSSEPSRSRQSSATFRRHASRPHGRGADHDRRRRAGVSRRGRGVGRLQGGTCARRYVKSTSTSPKRDVHGAAVHK